ncbi:Polyphosphate kinase 2 [compost metagenome]
MFKATDTEYAPWLVANSNDKRRTRLNIIADLLSRIPYKEVPREKVKLPKRQKPGGYKDPDYPYRHIPQKF